MASEELPTVNLQPTPDHTLPSTNQQWESLHQLLAAVVACQDEHDIVKALTRQLHELIPTDAIGIARSSCAHVRLWSIDQSRETEARLRRYLLRRLGHVASDTPQRAKPRRPGRSGHLSLVPSSACTFLEPDETPTNAHEIPLALGQEERGLFFVQRNGTESFSEWERQALHIVGTVLAVSLQNAESGRFRRDLDRSDPLTDMLNSHAFDDALTRELRVGQRYGVTACLLVIGLDYFRTVNDRLGYEAGDQVLRSAAVVIREMVRDTDIVGRCGGDTFGVVLPHTERRQACHLAERLRERIERHLFVSQFGQVRITASMGLAAVPDFGVATSLDWATAAGSALKEAKAQGKNCVAVHAPQPPALACVGALSLAA
ncbi:MAG: GGDEF domain-containing protein [Nitrospira sp.]|nr:GGDEF domain-containing protein [Nitrospira sp.]